MRNWRRLLDRRVAIGTVVLAVVIVGVTIVAARSSDDPGTAARTDPAGARAELLALARRQDRATWLVTFRFERRFGDGRRFAEELTEVNRPPLHVNASPSTVRVDFGDKVSECTTTADGPQCTERRAAGALALADVYRVVVDNGTYTVERLPERTIAGERARCFRLVATRGVLAQLGNVTEQCFARDGVPLRTQVRRGDDTDTRTAQRVARTVTDATVDALLARLERDEDAAGR
jgi:hypothetical protein